MIYKYESSGLTSVTIGNSVTSIGNSAFAYCRGLTSVTIGSGVTYIADGAFAGCSGLESINVHPSNPKYEDCSGSNIIVEKSTRTLIVGCKGTEEIPNSVTSIGNYAFEGSGLTAVTIPNSVTSIGEGAFYFCGNLTSMVMENATPIIMNKNSFDDSQIQNRQITLYVPYGSKSAYEATDDYSEIFAEIVEMEQEEEVTDISLLDNAIYIEPFIAHVDNFVNIEVKLKNVANISTYGFELVLPEGITIATDSEGSFDEAVTLSSRHSNHAITTNNSSENVYNIAVASFNSKSLTGNDGLVLTIRAKVAEDMALGTYPVKIQNPQLVESSASANKPPVQETVTMVTIEEDYIKGDVNGDGVVDLADAVLVINCYVRKPLPPTFVKKAAYVDGDDQIDLADAVLIINYYVHKIPSLSRKRIEDTREPQ